MLPYRLISGTLPVLLVLPELGREVPEDAGIALPSGGEAPADIDKLATWSENLGIGMLASVLHPDLVRLDRHPGGKVLDPSLGDPEPIPTQGLDGQPLYPPGAEPDMAAMLERIALYWRPFHYQLSIEVGHMLRRFGRLLLVTLKLGGARPVIAALPDQTVPTDRLGWLASELGAELAGSPGYIARYHADLTHAVEAMELRVPVPMTEQPTPWLATLARMVAEPVAPTGPQLIVY